MNDATVRSIRRVIESIRENIGEQITIDDMARTAMFSKFHFTRLFQQATGVSPGRFLSAVRLQEAKRLLLSTSLSVTEISHMVGYSSVGTFSSRFKSSVGLCPTDYRDLQSLQLTSPIETQRPETLSTTLQGDFSPAEPDSFERTVFVGLFPDAIPQGMPARCAVLDGPGPFKMDNVPEGTWYVLAYAARPGETDDPESARVAMHGPVTVRNGQQLPMVRLGLRRMQPLDPPVLLALLDTSHAADRRGLGDKARLPQVGSYERPPARPDLPGRPDHPGRTRTARPDMGAVHQPIASSDKEHARRMSLPRPARRGAAPVSGHRR
ncbi:AraC family transcriptional regulator [Actinomadura sp. KC06]|uniref:helix-turn-helix domain-containing protein n=1 Tax=Actinomadura sp. KC06 TaxID=2530369 RepID=UPI001A9E243C|nr:AraC family transcriptional regulator [Actinomadura sp. KC06]